MTAGGRRLDRSPTLALPDDVVEIDLGHPGQRLGQQPRLGPWRCLVRESPSRAAARAPAAANARRTPRCRGRGVASPAFSSGTMMRSKPGAGGGQRHRERATDLADPAVETELADDRRLPQADGLDHTCRREQSAGDGDVVVGAGLGQRGRREADGDLAVGESLAAVHHSGANPVSCLGQRRVGQTDQSRLRQALRDVGLDLDQMALRGRPGPRTMSVRAASGRAPDVVDARRRVVVEEDRDDVDPDRRPG